MQRSNQVLSQWLSHCVLFLGLAPEANKLVKALKRMPMLHDEGYAKETKLYDSCEFAESTLVLP